MAKNNLGKTLTLVDAAEISGGRLVNESEILLTGINSLEDAEETDLSFLGNAKYKDQVSQTRAAVVLVPEDFEPVNTNQCFLFCKNPSAEFSKFVECFAPEPIDYFSGIQKGAVVADSAIIGENVHIGQCVVVEANAVIGDNVTILAGSYIGANCQIAEDVFLHPNVTILERCEVKENCIIHSGTVLGGDGFGFIPGANGHKKIPQNGIVVIEKDVEIGSNVSIDRARFGKTLIGEGTKIDNLVHIAHNVKIGKHCFIVAQTGISGSTTLGDFVTTAGQSGIAGHLTLGNNVILMGRAGVTKDIRDGEIVVGMPAIPREQFSRERVSIKQIPKILKTIKDLQKQLENLQG